MGCFLPLLYVAWREDLLVWVHQNQVLLPASVNCMWFGVVRSKFSLVRTNKRTSLSDNTVILLELAAYNFFETMIHFRLCVYAL